MRRAPFQVNPLALSVALLLANPFWRLHRIYKLKRQPLSPAKCLMLVLSRLIMSIMSII